MISETVMRYFEPTLNNPYHRYRSWENCYRYFRERRHGNLLTITDLDCLHLGFFLASWGMFRARGFLLNKSYHIHIPIIEELLKADYQRLWNLDIKYSE